MSETAVERLLEGIASIQREAVGDGPEARAIDAGREALRIAREGVPRYLQNGGCSNCGAVPRYLQNGGCSNCGAVPHTATCLIGQLAALLARCEGE